MNQGILTVHFVNPNQIYQEESFRCLDSNEISRSKTFHFEADAKKWVSYRGALKKIISSYLDCSAGEISLIYSDYGKPMLAPPHDWLHFNITHTDDLALLAVSLDGPVGIDIEPKERASVLLDCASSICHSSELVRLPVEADSRSLQLLRLWTKKEAFLKAIGRGLSLAPDTFDIPIRQDSAHHLSHFEMIEFRGLALVNLFHDRLSSHCAVACCPLTIREIHFEIF